VSDLPAGAISTRHSEGHAVVKVFGLAHCSTCKKAIAWLDAHGVEHHAIDYRAQPISVGELKAFGAQLGWERLVNRGSQTWRGLPDEQKSPGNDAQWLALVQAHPTLIRRPLLVLAGGTALAGFSAARYGDLFGTTG
jgi:Spx/MgsR family transcriptional regulator